MPFLRWSFWRLAIGARNITKTGQIGDGREAAAADYVVANARQGDIDDVIAKIDQFAYEKSFLINVGDEKGELLDAAVRRANPALVLELGTYCGYGSLRIARAAPSAKVFSVELSAANAEIAQRIWDHAGVDDRVTCVVGTIGDGGPDARCPGRRARLRGPESWTCCSSTTTRRPTCPTCRASSTAAGCTGDRIVVADNMLIPGSPKYRDYMTQQQGKLFATIEHKTHGEYQTMMPDLVLESEYLGGLRVRGRSALPSAWTVWPCRPITTAGRVAEEREPFAAARSPHTTGLPLRQARRGGRPAVPDRSGSR